MSYIRRRIQNSIDYNEEKRRNTVYHRDKHSHEGKKEKVACQIEGYRWNESHPEGRDS